MSKPLLPKQYQPAEVEARWTQFWLTQGYSHADESAPTVPYSITLPPPNVTGSLHMGHALGGTIQDTLIRWKRMQGFNAMWMPGKDHAGIATQMLVERDIARREGKSRHDLGRDAFLDRVWAWKERHGDRISEQMTLMGFSLDWERERFTMDRAASAAVREVFVKLYEDGLIYRAQRLVNWCTECFTAISDLEVNNIEEPGQLWELQYPIVGTDERITVATTRPETMLGDTAVAVHPDDERYRHLIGTSVRLPLCDREIPIVADTFVQPEFGSGAVKVTPGHDFNDFECGQRCGLEVLSIIDHHGVIIAPAPEKYRGMSVLEARKAVVADLAEKGYLGNVRDYAVARGRCDRSNTVIEPLLSEQWFVRAEPLARPAIEAVEKGRTKFVPELWTKTYMHWMTNIQDWCISRQLWWGHRIPAWYCGACGEATVAREDPTACAACGSGELRQDEDVLDTWFSSALWPFSTLGWPQKNRALAAFYPNTVLVTAPDIIFFWVARMMMAGLHFMGKVPFRTVYFTPIVTDENGDKMSKVKGNVIDPLDVVRGATLDELVERARDSGVPEQAIRTIKKQFPKGIAAAGADALRFSLLAMTLPGRNVRLSMERIEGYRHFINKLWNASRFALMNLSDFDAGRFHEILSDWAPAEIIESLTLADRWILSRLQRAILAVDEALEAFRMSDAANALYHFVWHELCDWYIELAKPYLRADPSAGQEAGPDADEEAGQPSGQNTGQPLGQSSGQNIGQPLGQSSGQNIGQNAGHHAGDEVRRFYTQGVLATVLESSLRLLHPLTPFVTEEIWQKLPRPPGVPASLMVTIYPRDERRLVDEQAEAHMALLQELSVAVRNLRATYGVPPQQRVSVEVRAPDDASRAVLEAHRGIIEQAARADLRITAGGEHVAHAARSVVGADIEVIVPLEGLIDIDAERARIEKELGKSDKEIAFIKRKLDNESFVARAPAAVVEKERARLDEEETRKARLNEALEALR